MLLYLYRYSNFLRPDAICVLIQTLCPFVKVFIIENKPKGDEYMTKRRYGIFLLVLLVGFLPAVSVQAADKYKGYARGEMFITAQEFWRSLVKRNILPAISRGLLTSGVPTMRPLRRPRAV
jgi:hypothetical protein